MEKGDREKGKGMPAGSGTVREKSRTAWVGMGEMRRKGNAAEPVFSVCKIETYYIAFQIPLGSLLRQAVRFLAEGPTLLVLHDTIPLVQNQNHWRINTALSGLLPASWENLNMFYKTG